MFQRGIQVFGLIISMISFSIVYWLRKQNRLSGRSYIFWVCFWLLFVIIDVFPSLTSYITPYFDLGTNMYTLVASSIMILFVMVFSLFSYLYDLNYKIDRLVRDQALSNWKNNVAVNSGRRDDT